jgi:ribosome biogenesis protein NSA1
VGSGKGRMLLFDFRQQKVVHAYRGFTGSIRQMVCHPTKPLVVSVGLDRFVRVHHLDRQAPLHKSYLKSRLNAVLMRQDFGIVIDQELDSGEAIDVEKDSFWNTMEEIKDRTVTEIEDQVEKEAIKVSPIKNCGLRKKRRTVS